MTNLQAALGLAQLERLDEFIQRKRNMGKLYTELLADVYELELPLTKTEYADNIYWVYGVVLKDSVPFDAKEAMKKLREKKIGTRPFFWCMHEQPVFQKMGLFKQESCPVSENIARRGFYLPRCLVGLSVWVRSEFFPMVGALTIVVILQAFSQNNLLAALTNSNNFNWQDLYLNLQVPVFYLISMFLVVGAFLVTNKIIYGYFLGLHSLLVLEEFSLLRRIE
ncbi:MAG: hypothetical protein F6K18_11045 [Okeania sp. SIO2C2]|nr:hypothetical protein [Okeania sp. SIO2C2]